VRRLYLKIYAAFIGVLLLFGVLLSATWWLLAADNEENRTLEGMGVVLGEVLPPANTTTATLQTKVDELAALFRADLSVLAPDGAQVAASGEALPPLPRDQHRSGWLRVPGGPVIALLLPDHRWVLARSHHRHRGLGLLLVLSLLLVVTAAGSYPVVRRVTRRLERLQAQVEALGAGELTARVKVEGNDEVAELARSFNRAAERIERLVGAQKGVLANVSHELRTPLARMRMTLELLPGEERPELRRRLQKDIAELDELIGELLLASRLDAQEGTVHVEEVELLALAAEEAAGTNADVSGEPARLQGDVRLLRRLLRNLLQNAQRHAAGAPAEVTVQQTAEGVARVTVSDRGPGVPESESERIFEPFYRLPGSPSAGEGAGLGLALVRQIARLHGGDARCLARDGGGSSFVIEIRSLDQTSLRQV
jgi:signal transduction histidine kinase